MKENIKLAQILSGLDKIPKESLTEFLSSDAGKKLKNALSDSDKKALLEKFMSLDTKEVADKLKNADLSKLNNMSADDIIKKLR